MAGIIRHGTRENIMVKGEPFLAPLRSDRSGSVAMGAAEEGRTTAFETSVKAPGDMKLWPDVEGKPVVVGIRTRDAKTGFG